MSLPEPYLFVRAITLTLATVWTIGGLYRLVRFSRRWERRLRSIGLSRRWLVRKALVVVARATVLDPVNLALICTLLGLWSIRTSI